MKALDKETAIARMNTFGRKDIPFLFIIDYTQECSYVEALDKIDASACLYQFRGTAMPPLQTPDMPGRRTGNSLPRHLPLTAILSTS